MKLSIPIPIIAILLAAAAPSAAENVIANPGFEDSVAGNIADNGGVSQWGNFNATAGNATVQSDVVHSGANALALNVNPTGSQGFTIVYQNSGGTLSAGDIEGKNWTYRFWVRTPGGTGTFNYAILVSNAANQDVAPAGGSGAISAVDLPADTWVEITGSFSTTTYTPVRNRMKMNFMSTNGTSTFYVDDIELSVVQPPTWVGASGSGWGTDANWDPTGVPAETEAVRFGVDGSTGTVNLGAARTQAGLVFEADVPTTISGPAGADLTLLSGTGLVVVEAEGDHIVNAPVVLGSQTRFTGVTGNVRFTGGISGDYGISKEGWGTLALSGANTYSGATTVTDGELNVSGGSLISPVTVSGSGVLSGTGNTTTVATVGSGGMLMPGGIGSVGVINLAFLTLNSGGLIELDFGSSHDLLNVGTLTLNGGSLRLLTEGSGTRFESPGVYTIASFDTLEGSLSSLTIANPVTGIDYSLAIVGSTLRLTVSTGSARFWNGNGIPDVEWNTAANWSGSSLVNGARLIFGESPSAPASHNNVAGGIYQTLVFTEEAPAYEITGQSISLTADAAGDAVVNDSLAEQIISTPLQLSNLFSGVSANSAPITLSGNISGSGGIRVKGSEALTLTGNNTFSGGLVVESGSGLVEVTSAAALGAGPVSLLGGGISNISGAPLVLSTDNPLTLSGSVSLGGPAFTMASSNVTVAADTVLIIDEALSVGSVSGSSRLTVSGGIFTLGDKAPSSLSGFQLDGGRVNLTTGTPTLALTGADSLRLRSGGEAHFEMTTGTLDIAGRWRIANDYENGSAAIYGGTINHTGGDIELGFNGGNAGLTFGGSSVYNGTGRLIDMGTAWQSRVSLVIQDQAVVNTGDVVVGGWNAVPNSFGLAALTVRDTASLLVTGNLIVARDGQSALEAQFNQLSGTVSVTGEVEFGADGTNSAATVVGSVNLLGGVLTASAVDNNPGGTSSLNFLGGTLAIGPDGTGDIGADRIVLYQNAVIDTGDGAATITGPLVAPTGSGVTAVAVSSPGSDYQLAPPLVRITGGSGSGATAVAEVDPDTGWVTGITVTSPGIGYAPGDELVVSLLGGSGTGATAGAVSLAANSSYSGGLTKLGSGTLTILSPVPATYLGDTVVTEGRLSLQQDVLAASSTVRIATGAELELQSGQNERVRRLFIGGIQRAAGTWGAIGSGAQHESAAITGADLLIVTEDSSGAGAYELWAATFGPEFNASNNDPALDPDHDGISNLLEFVLGGSPLVSDSEALLPRVTLDDTNFNFVFNRSAVSVGEVTLTVEYSADLVTWKSIAVPAASSGSVSISIPRSESEGGKLFARLKAEE